MGDGNTGHRHTADCDTDGCAGLEAEGEVSAARLILDGGDLQHAAGHIAGAVGSNPALPEAWEALAEHVARAGGPRAALQYFAADQLYTGNLACRAALLAALGEQNEAVGLLSAVIGAAPALPWASVAWLSRPGLAQALDPAVLGSALAHVTQAIDDPADEAVRGVLEPYFALVQAAVAAHPESRELAAMASSLARRMDELETAIRWGRAAGDVRFAGSGDALGVVMLGSALRRAGRNEEAVSLWQAAVQADPTQTYLAVDLAETLATDGRPEEGITVLEKVLEREPVHEKAAPAVFALRYQIDPDVRHLVGLHDHLQVHRDHDYARYLLQNRCRGKAWLGRPEWASEAVTNGIRQLVERKGAGYLHDVHMSLSGLEPPSATLAARLAAPNLRIEVAAAGTPDPRLPQRPVDVQVWRYEGFDPYPAVDAPSEHAAKQVAELTSSFDWPCPPALWQHCAPLGELTLADLLGLLVHPPAPAEARWHDDAAVQRPDAWLRAVQTVVCTGIAHYRPEQPWAQSERRSVLMDLLEGPEDWVCEAAGMALVASAWVLPELREEVATRLARRLGAAVDAFATRPVSIAASLCKLVLCCGWINAKQVGTVRTLLARFTDLGDPAEA